MIPYNQPDRGAENWDVPLNENFEDLSIEVVEEVATWSELPAAGETTQSSNGQWPVYRVAADNVFVKVDDTSQSIIGGLGSANRPLPPSYFEKIVATDSQYEAIAAEELINVPQIREISTSGSGTKTDPFVIDSNPFDAYTGLVNFGKGWFETDGIGTDPENDYSEESAYLQGDGIRTTTLHHAADSPTTPTVKFQSNTGSGNFGGIRDMTVYGAGEGDKGGSANIIESDGNIIDLQFENIIVRYGGGDGIHLSASASGTRIQNTWIEQVDGACLNVRGGTRIKISDLHSIGSQVIDFNASRSKIEGVTSFNGGGNTGIKVTSSRNSLYNIHLDGNFDDGIVSNGNMNKFDRIAVNDTEGSALKIGASNNRVTNAELSNFGSDFGAGVRVLGDDFYGYNIHGVYAGEKYDDEILRLEASNAYVNGVGGDSEVSWGLRITSGTENVIDNVHNINYPDIVDEGERTLINRWGENAGNPNSTGQWNGNAAWAGLWGATIWDTTTSPWTAYEPTPDGSEWIAP